MLWVLLILAPALAQDDALRRAAFIGGNKNAFDTNPALATLLLGKYGITSANQCSNIPSIGGPAMGVKSFMQNIESALSADNANTRFNFIFYEEKKKGNRLEITAVSRLRQLNGDGGYILQKLTVNPYANPSVKVNYYFFDKSLDRIKAIVGRDKVLDPNGFVGCGDMKAAWSQILANQAAGGRDAPQNAAASAADIAAAIAKQLVLSGVAAGTNRRAARVPTQFNGMASLNPQNLALNAFVNKALAP